MARDETLANRVRALLTGTPGLEEKKLFGGLAFLVHGHIVANAYRDGRLLVTCSQSDYAKLLTESGAGPMLRSGKAISGWILVDADTAARDDALQLWVRRGLAHSLTRPPKE